MGIPVHTVEMLNEANGFARTDRVLMGLMSAAYGAGTGAGTAVTVALPSLSSLPATAGFFLGEAADVTAFLTGSVATGLTLNVEPRLAANTVAAGAVTILIVA